MEDIINGLIKFIRKHGIYHVFYHIIMIILFAIIYYIIYKYHNGSFRFDNINTEKKQLDIIDFLYFSLVTQSTVGYGDITPVHRMPKIIVMCQIISIYAIIALTFIK